MFYEIDFVSKHFFTISFIFYVKYASVLEEPFWAFILLKQSQNMSRLGTVKLHIVIQENPKTITKSTSYLRSGV